MDSWTYARRLQLRGQPRYYTAFRFKSLAGTLRSGGIIRVIAKGSIRQLPCVVAQMVRHESLDKIVAVIVARLHAQR